MAIASMGPPGGGGDTIGARRLGYGLALAVSMLLHGAAWYSRGRWEEPPQPKPMRSMEVALVARPLPVAPAAPAAPAAAPKPPEPKPPPRPKPAPPKPSAKPKPALKPVVRPKPATPPPERSTPIEPEVAPKIASPAAEPPAPPAAESALPAPGRPGGREGAPPSASAGDFVPASAHAAYGHNPKPEYPAVARQRHWEGRVVLRVKVLADGRCGHVEVHQSSGHEVLDESALEAVRNWRFIPAKRAGQPVESWVNVPINFNLEG
ncbi:energy transducer TonB [Candidatus Methylocalor cossyra]|uniref:Protein tonB2 n=1 Tax=Candidatus Methylocalor cossyra TaxID=3108543 RepID=A0ABM9NKL3_9GAMM